MNGFGSFMLLFLVITLVSLIVVCLSDWQARCDEIRRRSRATSEANKEIFSIVQQAQAQMLSILMAERQKR